MTNNYTPYAVLFRAGTHGTWLTWFISMHSEFNTLKLEIWQKTNQEYVVPKKFCWNHHEVSYTDFLSSLENFDKPKLVLKVFPHHQLNHQSDHYIEGFFKQSKCKHVIHPIVMDVMRDEINSRWEKIRRTGLLPINFDPNNLAYDFSQIVKDKAEILHIDIGKLLSKEQSEYQRLLDFIGEQPLDNWHNYVDQVIKDCYSG